MVTTSWIEVSKNLLLICHDGFKCNNENAILISPAGFIQRRWFSVYLPMKMF